MDAVEALEDKEMDLSELPLSSIMKSALCKSAWLPIKQGFPRVVKIRNHNMLMAVMTSPDCCLGQAHLVTLIYSSNLFVTSKNEFSNSRI